jgi:hypothetical protein
MADDQPAAEAQVEAVVMLLQLQSGHISCRNVAPASPFMPMLFPRYIPIVMAQVQLATNFSIGL